MAAERPAPLWWRRHGGTVRFRITALATILVAAVLAIAAVGLVVTQQRVLTGGVDEAIEQRADDLEGLLASGSIGDAMAGSRDDDVAVQVVGSDGSVRSASPGVAGAPPLADPPPAGRRQSIRTSEDVPGADGPVRILSRRVDGSAVLHVAGSLDDVQEAARTLATSLLVAIPVVVALLAALIWWLVGRTLRPVDAIRAEVATISGSELQRRVPEPAGDDEIARLARTMNTMLDRVEEASVRQQRFVADASHELRSPLTRIRSELEVDLAHPETADLPATHHSVLDETVGLQQLVDDLLHLARADAGAADGRVETVDLDDLVLREARRLRDGQRVAVDVSRISAAQVRGDPGQLQRIVRNLADNAQRYAASTVTFGLVERAGCAQLTVADDGPGVPPEQRERIFERFTRSDDARTRDAGGAGLGLAIVRELVERHGGTVRIEAGAGGCFVVRLPLAG
jgi:signal transduction histidine kinase